MQIRLASQVQFSGIVEAPPSALGHNIWRFPLQFGHGAAAVSIITLALDHAEEAILPARAAPSGKGSRTTQRRTTDLFILFCSTRGAFGGQIIAQSARAAGQTVEPALLLHSLHCYFLSFGDVDFPVLYMIDRARDGRSYATRTVKAVQKGKEIFVLVASFQKPEPAQPRFQIDISQHEIFRNVAAPDVSTCSL